MSEWSERDFIYRLQYLTDQGPCALFAQNLQKNPDDPVLMTYLSVCSFSYLDKQFGQCMKQQHQLDLPTDMLQEFQNLMQMAATNSPINAEELKVIQGMRHCMTQELTDQFAERAERIQHPSVQKQVMSSWDSAVLQAKSDETIDASRDTKEEVQEKFKRVCQGTCAPYSVLDSNGQVVEPNINNLVNAVYRFEMFDSCVNMTMCASAIRECMNRSPNMTAVDCLFSNDDAAVSQCRKRLADDIEMKGQNQ